MNNIKLDLDNTIKVSNFSSGRKQKILCQSSSEIESENELISPWIFAQRPWTEISPLQFALSRPVYTRPSLLPLRSRHVPLRHSTSLHICGHVHTVCLRCHNSATAVGAEVGGSRLSWPADGNIAAAAPNTCWSSYFISQQFCSYQNLSV